MPRVPPLAAADGGARADREPETVTLPPPSVVTPEPLAVKPEAAAPVAAIDDASADVAIVPEPLPEIDAFAKDPPGWDKWSAEQRQDYKDGLFEKLARREALLEREIAADAATREQKIATLDLLRKKRDELLAGTRTRPPRNDAEP